MNSEAKGGGLSKVSDLLNESGDFRLLNYGAHFPPLLPERYILSVTSLI